MSDMVVDNGACSHISLPLVLSLYNHQFLSPSLDFSLSLHPLLPPSQSLTLSLHLSHPLPPPHLFPALHLSLSPPQFVGIVPVFEWLSGSWGRCQACAGCLTPRQGWILQPHESFISCPLLLPPLPPPPPPPPPPLRLCSIPERAYL